MKDSVVRARIDGDTKKKAEEILHKLGISTSEAINVYFNQILLNNGLPFQLRLPNSETLNAIEDANNKSTLTKADNTDDMFNKLGI